MCRGPSISSHRVRVYILWSLFKFAFPTKKDTILLASKVLFTMYWWK